MSVLKIKKDDGTWESIGGSSSSIIVQEDEPADSADGTLWLDIDEESVSGSTVNGGDADTVDGKHASEFALASDVEALQTQVGDTSVSDQIANAIEPLSASIDTKVDKIEGYRMISPTEAEKIESLVIGEGGQLEISGTVNADNVQGLDEKLDLKVDKVSGKGLSTNDFTTAEKEKLAGIATGATKISVDSELSGTSTNPVQNKVVNTAISDLQTKLGDMSVSEQISAATTALTDTEIDRICADFIINDTQDSVIIPDYWLSALQDGAEAINAAMLEAGYNKSAFLFYSDAHWSLNSKASPTLLKYLYEHTAMTKTIFGGDIVSTEATDYDTMSYLWEWRNMLKGLPNHHSVVGNHDDGQSTNNLFDEKYVYAFLLAAEETPDIVRGDSGIYYYIDSPAEKTRYLYLDTAYKGVDDAQTTFITNALKETPSGWHIVVVAHIWYQPSYGSTTRPIPIEGFHENVTELVTLLDNYNARSGVFSGCGAKVEFCIGGHAHIDYDGTTPGGIPVILVEVDCNNIRSGLTYTKGTTTEASVNGIVADYTANKVHVIRVGRGESRTVTLDS